MSFDTTVGAGYAVLYSVLVFFTVLAVISADYLTCCLPDFLRRCCVLRTQNKQEDGGADPEKLHRDDDDGDNNKNARFNANRTADFFLSARNSAGPFTIAASFFASGMGAWVVYGTTQMGATPRLSWLGVLGYSGASAAPAVVVCFLGPRIRRMTTAAAGGGGNDNDKDGGGGSAFCTTDFGRMRYGRVMQISIASVSVFYMFIFIVAELTSASNVYALIVGEDGEDYARSIAISLGAFTVFYTSLAGLPASIVTDKFQGLIMALLVIMLTVAVSAFDGNRVTREQFAEASNWTADGLMAAVTLFIAIACAEMFNQGTWQRVWAAESVPAMRRGFLLGSVLVFLLMMFFGIMGMIAYANDPEAYDSFEKWAYLSFFDLLEPLSNFWHVVVLILVTALAASSIDSLQNALTCIFSADLVKIGWNPKWISRLLLVAINVPAIFMASKQYDVISLFLVADLVCATSVLPVFFGLMTTDWKFLPAPTELGAFLGCVSGVVAVVVNGYVNDANDGGLFDYFWLNNGDICDLCGTKTMVTFIVTPLIGGFCTFLFSKLDLLIRGKRARRPIFPVPFDKNDYIYASEVEHEDEEKNVDENVSEEDHISEEEMAKNWEHNTDHDDVVASNEEEPTN